MAYRELLPAEALARFEAGGVVLLDVRTPLEWQGARVPGSVHIPLDELTVRCEELDPAAETLVLCAHGVRSAAAGQWLAQAGFENVANVRYGLSRWPGRIEVGAG
jgi:rhodanese-related sulfurtransferase